MQHVLAAPAHETIRVTLKRKLRCAVLGSSQPWMRPYLVKKDSMQLQVQLCTTIHTMQVIILQSVWLRLRLHQAAELDIHRGRVGERLQHSRHTGSGNAYVFCWLSSYWPAEGSQKVSSPLKGRGPYQAVLSGNSFVAEQGRHVSQAMLENFDTILRERPHHKLLLLCSTAAVVEGSCGQAPRCSCH